LRPELPGGVCEQSGRHTGLPSGYNLGQDGDALRDAPFNGGALLDSVTFGPQLTDGRGEPSGGGSWARRGQHLARRTWRPGSVSARAHNEWLAIGVTPFENDFVELYNSDPLPVALGGLYSATSSLAGRTAIQLRRQPSGAMAICASMVSGSGSRAFELRPGWRSRRIGLFLPNLTPIDCIWYQAQLANISQGRSPNGGSAIVFFDQPTPGAPNPLIVGPVPFGGALVINEVLALNASGRNQRC
jgi:hypothetical protein